MRRSHKAAKAAGLKTYFTGKACRRGHVVERYALSGDCVACQRDRLARWRIANPTRLKNGMRQYCKNNSAKINGMKRNYYAANKEKIKGIKRKWRASNPSKSNFITAQYRAQKISATPTWACKETMREFYAEAVYQGMHVDHIVPLRSRKVCGLHWEGNMQLLISQENVVKGNQTWPDQ
jgi:hypothetical protein